MNFNSLSFVQFFLLVWTVYWLLRNRYRAQNIALLLASVYFYACWSVPYLAILFATIGLDFLLALAMDRSPTLTSRRLLLTVSLVSNLGVLGFFKYFDFLAGSLAQGLHWTFRPLGFLLPVGISFYTFHSMSYTIDVYRKVVAPTRRLTDFMLYVVFFPQLVAGPIARASALLPQFQQPRNVRWRQINEGIYLILWGYFQKLVIADNLARIADPIFLSYTAYEGLDLALAVVAFGFQILCDFAGYTDIARGLSKLMGFELNINFNLPYFAQNPKEFWSRWHLSLSTWFRDYVYIPLGGNRASRLRHVANLLGVMLLAGLWHGASWNFALWGLYHGAGLAAYHMAAQSGLLGAIRIPKPVRILLLCAFVMWGWILFRCHSLPEIAYFVTHLSLVPGARSLALAAQVAGLVVPLVLMQNLQYRSEDLLIFSHAASRTRSVVYAGLLLAVCFFGQGDSPDFIYFRF